jgi:hypothetical protein
VVAEKTTENEKTAFEDLIVLKDYLHFEEDSIPDWIYEVPELLTKYYADPRAVDFRLYEVEVEGVFDTKNWVYTPTGFRLGNDVFVKREPEVDDVEF